MKKLDLHFQQFFAEGIELKKRGRPRLNVERATTNKERAKKSKAKKQSLRREQIAVLDMETDPFDNSTDERIRPFCAELYSDQFEPIVIWEENFETFTRTLISRIEALPGVFTIYAHNGGRFDFMFLIHKMRGQISFKGRGIMSAKIGNHHLRDSFHLIPERLAAYQKDVFDYSKMKRGKRGANKKEILAYLHNDCVYLFDLVKKFVGDFGLKLSIGQAAMGELKKIYEVAKFTDAWDDLIRDYFFGGRVECIRGVGNFQGEYNLYDVNSMYSDVMSRFMHPIGAAGDYRYRAGVPGNDTVFVDLTCKNNGALVGRSEDGATSARIPFGRFKTTIWEYETALKYNLISDVQVHYSLDCARRTNFSQFVEPLYQKRLATKEAMKQLKALGQTDSAAFVELKKDDMFYKFLLNNAYGKFAQNPRRFKEHFITNPDEMPPDAWFKSLKNKAGEIPDEFSLPCFESSQYSIWSKPAPSFSFNNVGTAASITGAARAVLLDGLMKSIDPIYCDTDSIICKGVNGLELHPSKLGAWDLEDEFKAVVILGKKLYSPIYKSPKPRTAEQLADGMSPDYVVKSKGASGIDMSEMIAMLNGETITKTNKGPTLNRFGQQIYMRRKIRATGQKEI